jgi:hypothetical protein
MAITSKDIVAVLGPVDETLMAQIIATGATQSELAEAFAWTSNDEAMIGEGRSLPAGKVAAVIELLEADDEEPE